MDQNHASVWCFSLLNTNLKAVNSVSTELIVKYLRCCLSSLVPEVLWNISICLAGCCQFLCYDLHFYSDYHPNHLITVRPLSLSLSLIWFRDYLSFTPSSQYLGYVHTLSPLTSHLLPLCLFWISKETPGKIKKIINVLFVIRDNSWTGGGVFLGHQLFLCLAPLSWGWEGEAGPHKLRAAALYNASIYHNI